MPANLPGRVPHFGLLAPHGDGYQAVRHPNGNVSPISTTGTDSGPVDETGIVRPTAEPGARLCRAHAPQALTVSANLDASIMGNSGNCPGQAGGNSVVCNNGEAAASSGSSGRESR